MAGVFDTSNVAFDTQSSTPSTGGVQDTSGASTISNIGKALGVAAQGVEAVFSPESEDPSGFASQQLNIADAVATGSMTKSEGARRWRNNAKKYLADGGSFDVMSKTMTKLQGTVGLGKVVSEGTEEEQLRIDLENKAAQNGFINAGDSDEEKAKGLEAWQLRQKAESDLSFSQQSLTVGEATKVATAKTAVINLGQSQYYKLGKEFGSTLDQFQEGTITEAQALEALETQFGPTAAAVNQVGARAGSDVLRSISSPLGDLKKTYEDAITGKIKLDTLKRKVDHIRTGFEYSYMMDDTTARLSALTKILGPNTVMLPTLNEHTSKILESITNNTQAGLGEGEEFTPASVTAKNASQTEALRGRFKFIKDNVKNSNQADNPQDLVQAMNTQLESTLIGVSDYASSVKNPKEFNEVSAFLASPEVGTLVTTQGGVPAAVLADADSVMKDLYTNRVLPAIKKEYEQVNISGVTSSGTDAKSTDLFEPVFQGGGVVFKPKQGVRLGNAATSDLRALNAKAGAMLNRLVRMGAHLEGHTNYKKTFDEKFIAIFGVEQDDKAE